MGIEYFVTYKLKWQIERNNPPVPFPYNLFWWEGPDGSRVLAYQTLGSYADEVKPDHHKLSSKITRTRSASSVLWC